MIIRLAKYFYIFLILIFFGYSAYLTYFLYQLWSHNDFSKYYLPPHQSIAYFIQYSFFHFWSHFLAALIFSLLILFLAKYFNNKHDNRYFWPEEPYFLAMAILIVGYPGWLIYFGMILVAPLLFSIFYFLLSKKIERISYYYFWLSLAVGAILINKWLSQFAFWGKLII